MDLTEPQLDLMWEHFMLDNPQETTKPEDDGKARDPNYEEPEHYHDPDFDTEWNAVEEVPNGGTNDWEEVD